MNSTTTYTEKLIACGYTEAEAREASDRNRRTLAKIAAVNKQGRARGTINRKEDVRAFRNA